MADLSIPLQQYNPLAGLKEGFQFGAQLQKQKNDNLETELTQQKLQAEIQAKNNALQSDQARRELLNIYTKTRDPKILNGIFGYDPVAAQEAQKGVQITMANEGQAMQSFLTQPLEYRVKNYASFVNNLSDATKQQLGLDDKNYSSDNESKMKFFVNSTRKIEDQLSDTQKAATLAKTNEEVKSEKLQQRKIGSDIEKNYIEIANARRKQAQEEGGIDPITSREIDVNLVKATDKAAQGSQTSLQSLDQLEKILLKNKNRTGKLRSIGIATGNYLGIGNDKILADYQAAKSLTTKQATAALQMMGGNDSNTDVALQITAAPSFDKRWEANKRIIENQRAAAKMAQKIPDFQRNWIGKNGSTLRPDKKTGQNYQEAFNEWQGKMYEKMGGEFTIKPDENEQNNKILKYNANTGKLE
jgi:hypothetical protein